MGMGDSCRGWGWGRGPGREREEKREKGEERERGKGSLSEGAPGEVWGGGHRVGGRGGGAGGVAAGARAGGGGAGSGSSALGVGCRHLSPTARRSPATDKTLSGKDNMR
ncbi:hypothetical protein TIFTF001_003318 [Ficus carica]|uniref:Uncharacterized protein n=1 Tax=Ficus carica TaxID=3494 RepID=A0AA87ZF78_FICCA|nr:hypothetical protein TIFTF001_003318 [Ficus carica]